MKTFLQKLRTLVASDTLRHATSKRLAGGAVLGLALAGWMQAASGATTSFTTAGTNTFTVPAGVSSIKVEVWGGGGGGGAGNGGAGGGSGGGGGAYGVTNMAVVVNDTVGINVGAGGSAGSGAGGNGGAGGITLVTVAGTNAVTAANGTGGPGGTTTLFGSGGAGANGGHSGGNGATGGSNNGGGGGGSATSAANGNNGSGTTGGSGQATGGAGGGTSGDGVVGGAPGAGGGGAGKNSTTGGAGAAGQVIITYTQVVTPPTKVVFSTAPLTNGTALTAGVTSGLITIQLQDATSAATTTNQDIVFNLSSDSTGTKKFRDGGDTADITSVKITNGTSSVSFRYNDQKAGLPTITAAASGTALTTQSASQIEMVNNAGGNVFIIVDPTDGTVDNSITVTVQLKDQFGNLVTTGADKDKDVTLNTSGSATGGGVVDIVNGVGSLAISDHVAETVNLSLTDSAGTGYNVASTQNVIFGHGAANKFVIINPTDGTVDAAITVTVKLQDLYGNTVTTGADKDKDVTLNTSGSATGGGVVDIVNGVGSLAISDHVAETVNLTLSDSATTGFNVSSTQDVVFGHGAANKFAIINPTDGTVDAAITVTVKLQDLYGNTVTTGADKDKDVTLNASGSATGGGVVDIVNGVGSLAISDHVAETVNLSLTDSASTGYNVSSTQDVVFGHGAANKFAIINPTDGTVDAAITVTVKLQDQYGNTVTTGADKDKDVTLNTSGSATGGGVVDIVNGVGTKSISDQVAETVNLSLTDSATTGFNVSSTQDVVFANGAATKFVIINPTDGTVDAAITVTVKLQDQYGNTVTTGVDKDKDVTLNASGSATGGGVVDIVNGVGTKSISDQVAETVNLSLTDSATTGFNVSSTQDVIFAHGAATKFAIINPTDGTVDAAITVTVKLQDQYGNTVTTGADKDKDVTLNTSGSATGGGVVDIVNGVGTKSISDQVAETVNLTLTDSATTGFNVSSTQDVIFAHGAATKFVIINPTDGTVDAAITVTVKLQDQYGNTVTTGADKDKDVTLNTSGSATGGGVVDIVNGVGTKSISDQVAETVNLTLTDSATTGFNVSSTQDVIFAHGAATKFVIINPTDGTVDAAITVTVKLQDQYGNTVTTGADKDKDVTLNTSGSATGGGVVDIVNGVGTKSISDHVAETVNLTLTDSATTGFNVSSTQDVVFANGAATKFVIINPTDGTVDAAITVTVKLQDQYGNTVTTGADKDKDVTLNTSGSATGGGVVDIANGVGTKSISDHVAETVNLSLTDSATTGFNVSSTQDVIFAHGAATKFAIIDPTDGTVDAAITVTVKLQDQYGNTVTTGADKDKDVTLNTSGSATGGGVVDIANGVGSLAISDHVAETVNLTLTDSATTGFNVSSTQNVVFANGAATKFVIIDPTDGTVDAAITVTVKLQDQYGNTVTTGADKDKDVTLNTSGSATGGGVVDIVNGVGTKSISDHVAETVNLTLTDSATTGFNVSSTQDLVFANGAATKFVIIDPTDGTVDAAITVTVKLQDQYGNTVTTGASKDKDVTLNTSGSATGGGVVDIVNGVGTKSISDHVAQTVNLTLTDSATTGFNVSSTQDVVFGHGVLDHFAVTASSSVPVATPFVTTVTAKDQYGNTVTSDSSTVVTMTGTGSVEFDSNGDTTTGDNTKQLSSGAFTISCIDNSVEVITITATGGGKTGTSGNISVIVTTYDYGDAPSAAQTGFASSYPTLLADGGARHLATGPTLGANRDVEADGNPSVGALGDDTTGTPDDEDGVSFSILLAGGTSSITVNVQGGTAKLNAWIDFNQNGSWSDAGEQIATNLDMSVGDNIVTVNVPLSATAGTTYARFRLSTDVDLLPTGDANDGEVEDYAVVIDVNDAPTDVQLSSNLVVEQQPAGTVVGTLITSDPDLPNDSHTYALVSGTGSDDNSFFQVSGAQLKTASSLVYATRSTYSIRVRTTDSGSLSFEKALTVFVQPLPPTQPTPKFTNDFTSTTNGWTRFPGYELSLDGQGHGQLAPGSPAAPSKGATDWGSYNNAQAYGSGFTTTLDINLDTNTANGLKFAYLVALNTTNSATASVEFAFLVQRENLPGACGYRINTGMGAPGSFENPDGTTLAPSLVDSIVVTNSDWYTFQHWFHAATNAGVAYLVVEMTLLDTNANVVASWEIATGDIIGVDVGGSRYGKVVGNEFPALLVDNSRLTIIPKPIALPTAATAQEDGAVTVRLSGTVFPASVTPEYKVVTGPTHGTLNVTTGVYFTNPLVTYTPASDYFGADTFTFLISNGAQDSLVATVKFTVNSINDAPSFALLASVAGGITVMEDSAALTVPVVDSATVSKGPANEIIQTITYQYSSDNAPLFMTQPSVSSLGYLTFRPAANKSGDAIVTIVAKDSGGTTNGGVDTSLPRFLAIHVAPSNDAPVLAAIAGVTVTEGLTSTPDVLVPLTLSDLETPLGSMIVNVTIDSQTAPAFVSAPVAEFVSGAWRVRAHILPEASGTATLRVTATDTGEGSSPARSAVQTFVLKVLPANDAPGFTMLSPTVGGTVGVLITVPGFATFQPNAATPGDPFEAAQTASYTVTVQTADKVKFATQPTISASGTLMYKYAPGAVGPIVVTVKVADNGGVTPGVNTSGTQNLTFNP